VEGFDRKLDTGWTAILGRLTHPAVIFFLAFLGASKMNPIKTIGRFQVPIASVVVIKARTGFWGWLAPGFDVTLTGGIVLGMNKVEGEQLKEEIETHEAVMQVMGMVAHQQRTNRP
jgi:hypothetical protein